MSVFVKLETHKLLVLGDHRCAIAVQPRCQAGSSFKDLCSPAHLTRFGPLLVHFGVPDPGAVALVVLAANWHQKDRSYWQRQLGQYIALNSG